MKKIIIITLVFVILCVLFAGCESAAQSGEREYTDEIQQQIIDMFGWPKVINFFEYSQLEEIYEMRDDPSLVMYWYTKSQMTGKWVYEGKCIGYGIPYGASITNPETRSYAGSDISIPQAEPNGLYTNNVTSSATWVLCIDENGDIAPNYVEEYIRVTPFKIDKNKVEEWSLPSDY